MIQNQFQSEMLSEDIFLEEDVFLTPGLSGLLNRMTGPSKNHPDISIIKFNFFSQLNHNISIILIFNFNY